LRRKVGDTIHAGLIAVLGDAEAFLGFRDGSPGDLDSLPGRSQGRIGAPHLEADGRIGVLLGGGSTLGEAAGFGDAGLVGKSVEQVPSEPGRSQPVGAAAGDEPLAVSFQRGMETHLRQQGTARGNGLDLRQMGAEMRREGVRTRGDRLALQAIEGQIRQVRGG
jgi:hypothetical protein